MNSLSNLENNIDKFINYCNVERRFSQHTIINYSIALKQLCAYFQEEYNPVYKAFFLFFFYKERRVLPGKEGYITR